MVFSPVTIGIIFALICTTFGEETRDAKEREDDVCKDEACKDLAKKITQQMGASSPCDDFHNYVCGNWSGHQETKFVHLKDKAVKDLIGLLEGAAHPPPMSPNATNKLLSAYLSCTRKGGDKEALKKSVRAVLQNYWLGGWPVLSDQISGTTKHNYTDVLEKLGPRPLFPYYAEMSGDTPYIVMKKPDDFFVSGLDYSDYYTDEAEPNNSSYESTTVSLSDNYLEVSEASYKTFIVKAITLLNDSVSEEKAAQTADEIIYFEKNLSKLAHEAQEKEQYMNVSEFIKQLPNNFPMDEVLNKDFATINFFIYGTTNVKVKCMEYYERVIEYLKKQSNMASLINFALWTRVRTMAKAQGTLLHNIYVEYERNTSIYKEENEKVSESNKPVISNEGNKSQCLRQLLQPDVMYSAGASYYIMHKFNGSSKTEATRIFDFILKEFTSFIYNNTWMSEKTKQDALRVLSSMDVVIGYPAWMLENTTIDYLYKYASSASENASFVEHYHNLKENGHFQRLLIINSCYFNKTNEEITLHSHAAYRPKYNILGYPAASLATHYRGHPIPRAVNFGTIGTIFAQLLSTVVERFNGTIPSNEFWDNETTKGFCSNSDCLNNTEECSDQKVKINNSSYQYFRDYNGVRISHKALKESKRNYTGPFLLPGEKFDIEDKIFFDAFGSLYCPYSLNENKKPEPVEARAFIPVEDLPKSLNEVVSKYKEFNSTFNCTGDVRDTCHLMPPNWKKEVPAC